MFGFDFQPRTRVIFGHGALDGVGDLAGELGFRRSLVVADPGIVAAGHAARLVSVLGESRIDIHLTSDVGVTPDREMVERGATRHGACWHFCRPPVVDLEFELDCRGVMTELVLP